MNRLDHNFLCRLVVVAALATVLACGGNDGGSGDGMPDAGAVDSGTIDADGGGLEDTPAEEDLGAEVGADLVSDALEDVVSDLDAGVDVPVDTTALTRVDEVYLEVDGMRLDLDLRVPEGPGPFAMVVVVHGGAFFMGDKATGNAKAWAEFLPTVGFASASVNYRLTGDFRGPVFPAPLQDVKCAVRWLRSRSDQFRLDPGGFVVLGSSAGGYFSNAVALAGDVAEFEGDCPGADTMDSAVQAGVSFFGISDWTTINDQRGPDAEPPNSEARFVGSECMDGPEDACTVASPITYLDSEDPPMFVLHSDDDPAIPVAQSQQLRDALMDAGVEVRYLEVRGKGHGWSGRFRDPEIADARDQVVEWLNQQVGR